MNIVLWIIQALLAVAFLGAGSAKLMKSHAALLTDPRMAWANDFSVPQIKLIGLAEVLGAIGLIRSMATKTSGYIVAPDQGPVWEMKSGQQVFKGMLRYCSRT